LERSEQAGDSIRRSELVENNGRRLSGPSKDGDIRAFFSKADIEKSTTHEGRYVNEEGRHHVETADKPRGHEGASAEEQMEGSSMIGDMRRSRGRVESTMGRSRSVPAAEESASNGDVLRGKFANREFLRAETDQSKTKTMLNTDHNY
ncbi:hypothetical protein ANN_11470, partial [Periplaneta americana]